METDYLGILNSMLGSNYLGVITDLSANKELVFVGGMILLFLIYFILTAKWYLENQ